MAIGYHFTLSQHKNSILETGLRRSKSGLDIDGIPADKIKYIGGFNRLNAETT